MSLKIGKTKNPSSSFALTPLLHTPNDTSKPRNETQLLPNRIGDWLQVQKILLGSTATSIPDPLLLLHTNLCIARVTQKL